MGVYVFKKSILVDSIRAVCEPGFGYDFGHHIIPALIHSARTYAYDFRNENKNTSAYWRDIGTIDAYFAASMDLLQETPQFDPYCTDSQPATPTRHPGAKHALCARVHSDAYVVQSVLSPRVQVEAGAEINGAILLPGVRVGKGARVRRAIVEEGVELPAGFNVGFDLEHDRKYHTVTSAGVVVIGKTPSNIKQVRLPVVFNSLGIGNTKKVRSHAVRATA
jgi:glucose-1-phosphate adenylyltransferase